MRAKLNRLYEVSQAAAFSRNTEGVAALEFAVLLPSLMMLLVIATDLSLAVYAKEQVRNAARAGSEFAANTGYFVDGIRNATINSVSSRKLVTITANDLEVRDSAVAR